MNKLCNICGVRPRSKNQGTCNQCRWEKHKAKENARRKTPEVRQQISKWNRTRDRTKTTRDTEAKHRKKYVAKYPEKEKAKWLLNRAIASGRIVRPEVCDECRKPDKRRDGRSLIQAHHDDYSMPLEVRWLCVQCHADLHRKLKDEAHTAAQERTERCLWSR